MLNQDQLEFSNNDSNRYKFSSHGPNSFYFVTDKGCYYTIILSESGYFLNNSLLNNKGELFEISFERSCDLEVKHDPLVNITIRHILSSQISSKGDEAVFYFMCDNSDGKGGARSRIFSNWFAIESEPHLFQGHLETILFVNPDNNEERYYLGLIISKGHSNFENYITEFKQYLSNEYFPSKNTLFD